MTDPIATSTLSVVVGDTDHSIVMSVVNDPDGSASLSVQLSLAVRSSLGNQVVSRLDGTFNLTQAQATGIVDAQDVAALRRVLVALGSKLAADAGMNVT